RSHDLEIGRRGDHVFQQGRLADSRVAAYCHREAAAGSSVRKELLELLKLVVAAQEMREGCVSRRLLPRPSIAKRGRWAGPTSVVQQIPRAAFQNGQRDHCMCKMPASQPAAVRSTETNRPKKAVVPP